MSLDCQDATLLLGSTVPLTCAWQCTRVQGHVPIDLNAVSGRVNDALHNDAVREEVKRRMVRHMRTYKGPDGESFMDRVKDMCRGAQPHWCRVKLQ